MFLYERVLTDIKESRDRVVNGLINCIPCPFKRFRATFPGLEKGKYIIFTASSKIGKTQISDEIALYNSFMYAFHHRDQIRLKVFYFTLEMSKEAKYRQFMCYLLYRLSSGKIRIDSKDLRSVNEEKPLTEEILALLKSDPYVEYYKFFEECVEFIDSIRNPTGIYKFCRAYAKAHGTQHTKQVPIKDKDDNVIEIKELDDYYEEDDLDEYRIIFVDHYKLFTLESGKDLRDTIGTWSSDYAITLRNKYHYTIIGVQQQAA